MYWLPGPYNTACPSPGSFLLDPIYYAFHSFLWSFLQPFQKMVIKTEFCPSRLRVSLFCSSRTETHLTLLKGRFGVRVLGDITAELQRTTGTSGTKDSSVTRPILSLLWAFLVHRQFFLFHGRMAFSMWWKTQLLTTLKLYMLKLQSSGGRLTFLSPSMPVPQCQNDISAQIV